MTAIGVRRAALLATVLVPLAAAPASAQGVAQGAAQGNEAAAGTESPAKACGDLAADFQSVVLRPERDRNGGAADRAATDADLGAPPAPVERRPESVGGTVRPSAIGEGITLDDQAAPAAPVGIALSTEDRRRIDGTAQAARDAAAQGDAERCRRLLNEARLAARQADARMERGGAGGTQGVDMGDAGSGAPSTVDVPDAVGRGARDGIPNRPGDATPLDDATDSPIEEALEPPPINPAGPSVDDAAPGRLNPNRSTPSLGGGGLSGGMGSGLGGGLSGTGPGSSGSLGGGAGGAGGAGGGAGGGGGGGL
ncbi:hypothetical protein [Azospirillum sp. ST 5-10]|uniref:hypothetical protein n=1 Tax=unclassified Azospirillum TaxID=2630922 RepID=UPI003F49E888